MIKTRRLVAIVCIAVIVFTGAMPGGAAFLTGVLVPLGPLFGTVTSTALPPVEDARIPAAPILASLASRAPPPA